MAALNFADIEKWVNEEFGKISPAPVLNKINLQPHPEDKTIKPPVPLIDWKAYATSGDNNNCMIHAFLMDSSPTFRKLPIDVKNTIADTYRRTIFLNLVLTYYDTGPGNKLSVYTDATPAVLVTDHAKRLETLRNLINSTQFLKQELLLPICIHYQFNVLFYSQNPRYPPFQTIPETDDAFNTSAPTIVIYNPDGVHFSAMSNKDGHFFIDTNIVLQLLQKIESERTLAMKSCQFENDSIIIINGRTYTVDDIRSLVNGQSNVAQCYVVKLNTIDKPVLLYQIKSIPTHTSDKTPKPITKQFDTWTIGDFGNYMNVDNIDFAKPLYTIVENPSNTFTLTPIGKQVPPIPTPLLVKTPAPAPPAPAPPIRIEDIMFEIECIIYKLETGKDCVITTKRNDTNNINSDEEEEEDDENLPVRINETISIEPPSDYHVEIISTNTNVSSDGRLEPGISTSEYITIQNENI